MSPILTGEAGTCGVCQGVFMTEGPGHVLVLHGYQRPGDGFIRGRCPGQGFEPYERSTAALEAYRPMCQRAVDGRIEWLRKLEAGEVVRLQNIYRMRPRDVSEADRPFIGPDHHDFAACLKSAIAVARRELDWANQELARVDQWIAAWTEQPYKAKAKSGIRLSDAIEIGSQVLVYGKRAEVLKKDCKEFGFRKRPSYNGIKVRRLEDGKEFVVSARTVKPLGNQ